MPKRSQHQRGGQWIRPLKRLAIYLRDRFTCQWCGRDLAAAPGQLTLDHWRSRAAGGSNEHTNLLTSCHTCNSRRRERRAGDWLLSLELRGGAPSTTAYDACVAASRQRSRDLRKQMSRGIIRQTAVARGMLLDLLPPGTRDLNGVVLKLVETPLYRQPTTHRGVHAGEPVVLDGGATIVVEAAK